MRETTIPISCNACGKLFRLDPKLVSGYRGARIRCRGCGHSILVSITADLPASRNPVPEPGKSAEERPAVPVATFVPPRESPPLPTRAAGAAAAAEPLAEASGAPAAPSDNLVDLHQFRSHQLKMTFGTQDISGKISPAVPFGAHRSPGTAAELPAEESLPYSEPAMLEEAFSWREPNSLKQTAVFPAVKFVLIFILSCATALYLGFELLQSIFPWTIG